MAPLAKSLEPNGFDKSLLDVLGLIFCEKYIEIVVRLFRIERADGNKAKEIFCRIYMNEWGSDLSPLVHCSIDYK